MLERPIRVYIVMVHSFLSTFPYRSVRTAVYFYINNHEEPQLLYQYSITPQKYLKWLLQLLFR